MVADWIKMRTDIYRDPRVSLIAEALMDQRSSLAGFVNQMCQRDMTVTRNVMRNAAVGALVSVWGVMRQRGKCVGEDLVCDGVTVAVLDDIADMPGIGDAMESAGWVEETSEGIVFRRFFSDYNIDPTEKSKQANADRQRRYRERQAEAKRAEESNVTRDVTVTPREEKRREEISSSLRSEEKRASRLAQDWNLPDEWSDWCRENRPDLDPKTVAYSFADYWHSKAGKDGRKADWFATWRNWCRNQRKELVGASKGLQRAPTAAEQRVIQACPDLAAPHLRQVQPMIFDMEAGDDAPKLLG